MTLVGMKKVLNEEFNGKYREALGDLWHFFIMCLIIEQSAK